MAKFLTATQVAETLGVERSTIQRWVDEGRFPGAIRTAGGHRRIPVEALEQMRCHNGKGKALLYLRVAHESDRQYLDSGIAHLTRYAVEHCYSVVKVVQEVGPGVDGQRPDLSKIRADIRSGEPGYEVILVERLDRLTLIGGGDEFAQWAAPSVRIEVAGSSCRDADEAYQREVLEDLYYPLADALALRGVPPAKVESIISKGLDGIAEALGLLQGKRTR